MHKVKFNIKNIEAQNELKERSVDFNSFASAVEYVRTLHARLPRQEVLLGAPVISEVA